MTHRTHFTFADFQHRASYRRLACIGLFCLAMAAFGGGVFTFAYRAEIDQTAQRGETSLALAADRLTTALRRFRELGGVLADHPVVLGALHDAQTGGTDLQAHGPLQSAPSLGAADLLQKMSDRTGTQSLMLAGADGRIVAATNDVGEAYLPPSARVAFDRAMHGALGVTHFVDPRGRRRFIYAAPVFEPGRAAMGAVIVNVDLEYIEWSWPTDPTAVFFTDEAGLVFSSNRTELILKGGKNDPLPLEASTMIAAHEVWTLSAGPYLPHKALHLSRDLPIVDLTAEVLLDLAPARQLAALQAGIVAASVLALSGFVFVARLRRNTLAQLNAQLEARVASRTQALEAMNTDLIREVQDREMAEAQLKRVQADLVQAGKLSALGEMSAGISHELNQPLMAIRSFCDNAQTFLERGKPERTAENLVRISDLSGRMARIIKNLRAFARQDSEAVTSVDLASVVDAALEMTMGKLTQAQADIFWNAPENVYVRGGNVRLQQVVVNLLSNAADALKDSPVKEIHIKVLQGDPVVLEVADTGCGLADPEKIYDPFYTTKEVGAAAGMGLGLSISYGLVNSFGGRIKARNLAADQSGRGQSGAVFTVELPQARAHHASDLKQKETS